MIKYQDNLAARLSGNNLQPLAGASVSVSFTDSGAPATIYADDGVTVLPQPLTTDNNGYFGFKAPDGKYTLTISGVRFATFTRQIVLNDPDDDLDFKQDGTGAITRKVQDELRERLTFEQFGAKGDGASDDTTSVQAALNRAGRIQLASGRTYIVTGLTIKSGTTLVGDGHSTVIKLKDGANNHVFSNANYASGTDSDIVFDGVVIDGNVAAQTNNVSYNKHGVRMKGVTGFVFRNGVVRNAGTDCINLIDCPYPTIRNNRIHGGYNSGVVFQNCHGLLGDGNTVYNCGSKTDAYGFTSSGHAFIGVNVACNDVRLTGNYVYDMGDSCLRNERAGQGWVIADNIVVNSGKDSIKIMGVVGSATKPKANIIANNVIIDAGNTGIVANGDNVLVTNNIVYGTGKNTAGAAYGKWFASAAGIALLDNPNSVTVTGNIVTEAYSSGIVIEGGAGHTLRGNTCARSGGSGIDVTNVDRLTAELNTCYDNGTLANDTYSGLRIQGTAASYSRHSVRFNRCFNTGATGQKYGLRLEGGANVSNSVAQFNDLYGNINAAQLFSNWSGTGNVINQNRGYVTESRGTATIASGATLATVAHGLSATPTADKISVTPTNSMGSATKFWIGAVSASNFQILVDADPGATTATFAWQVTP